MYGWFYSLCCLYLSLFWKRYLYWLSSHPHRVPEYYLKVPLQNRAIGRPEKNNLAQAIDNARPDCLGILGLLFGGLAAEKDIRHILKRTFTAALGFPFTRRGVYEFSHAHLIDNVPVLLSECGTEADNSQK